jgi:hypothetical protein
MQKRVMEKICFSKWILGRLAVGLVAILATILAEGYVDVPLQQAGFNFYASITVRPVVIGENETSLFENRNVILDTRGNVALINNATLPTNVTHYKEPVSTSCLELTEDTTSTSPDIEYSGSCDSAEIIASVGNKDSVSSVINVTIFDALAISNIELHNWTIVQGYLGLGYCSASSTASCELTAFQKLLLNISDESNITTSYLSSAGTSLLNTDTPAVFGLDLNPSTGFGTLSLNSSSMQMGYYDSRYINEIIWYEQSTSSPLYHQFMAEDLNMCGVSLMGSLASTYPVVVNTAQVCLGLPSEFYGAFRAWLNVSVPFTDTSKLPAISFNMFGAGSSSLSRTAATTFYIPLENLLVSSGILDFSDDASLYAINESIGICILDTGEISDAQYDSSYNTPNIVLGTLALKSIYFAANFTAGSVGLASKLDEDAAQYYASQPTNFFCSVPASCVGYQNYEYETNSCDHPSCAHYFFQYIDESTQTCRYKTGIFVFGMIIFGAIVGMEITSFFVLQQTSVEFYQRHFELVHPTDGNVPLDMDDRFHHRPVALLAKVDWLTRILGPVVTGVIDFVVNKILKWTSRGHYDHRS